MERVILKSLLGGLLLKNNDSTPLATIEVPTRTIKMDAHPITCTQEDLMFHMMHHLEKVRMSSHNSMIPSDILKFKISTNTNLLYGLGPRKSVGEKSHHDLKLANIADSQKIPPMLANATHRAQTSVRILIRFLFTPFTL